MNNLYEALENSLQALERGESLDAVLARYPDHAGELRPLLETARRAHSLAGLFSVPGDARRRGRARVLQRAAELRASRIPLRRRMIPTLPRLAIALGLSGALVLTSTGLVSASSGALPGDQLYSVKRTWENLRLLFVGSAEGRDLLESQYEQERLDEIDELLLQRRAEPILFFGLVTKQMGGDWLVSGIPVAVTTATHLSPDAIADGAPVMVIGMTRSDGVVAAQEIKLLQPGVSLPPLEPSENEEKEAESASSNTAVAATPNAHASESEQPEQEPKSYEFRGIVQSMHGDDWTINGQPVYVGQAEIKGAVRIGSAVKFEGYYRSDGTFVVTKIESESGSSGSDGGRNGSEDSGAGSNDEGNGDDDGGGGDDGP